MTPEILHLLFTAAGLLLGWYIKHQSIRTPADLLAYLDQLLTDQKHQQARSFLQDLLNGGKTTGPKS